METYNDLVRQLKETKAQSPSPARDRQYRDIYNRLKAIQAETAVLLID